MGVRGELRTTRIWTEKFPPPQGRTGVLPGAHQQHGAGDWGPKRGGWGQPQCEQGQGREGGGQSRNAAEEVSHQWALSRGTALDLPLQESFSRLWADCGRQEGKDEGTWTPGVSKTPPHHVGARLPCLLPAPLPNSLCLLRLRLTFSHFLHVAGLSKLSFFLSLSLQGSVKIRN